MTGSVLRKFVTCENFAKARRLYFHVTQYKFAATKLFLNLLGNFFASWEANFVSATMFPELGKQGNIDRCIMFPQQCFLVRPGP